MCSLSLDYTCFTCTCMSLEHMLLYVIRPCVLFHWIMPPFMYMYVIGTYASVYVFRPCAICHWIMPALYVHVCHWNICFCMSLDHVLSVIGLCLLSCTCMSLEHMLLYMSLDHVLSVIGLCLLYMYMYVIGTYASVCN